MIVQRLANPLTIFAELEDQVGNHLRLDGFDSVEFADALTYARAAMVEVQEFGQLALLTQPIRVTYDPLPISSYIKLPIGPVQPGATVTLTVDDESYSDFELIPGNRPAIRFPAFEADALFGARVVIEYEAGFGSTTEDVPPDLIHAIKDQAAALFEGRSPSDNKTQALSPHMARIAARYRRVAL